MKEAFGGVPFFSQQVLKDSKHAELVNLAAKTAILQRGVSHLIFPDEVQRHPLQTPADSAANILKEQAGSPAGRMPNMQIRPANTSLEAALALLRKSKRPVMIVGHGARFHRQEICALAEPLNMPVLTTFKGKGVVGDDHPLGCGVLGRSGHSRWPAGL